MRILSEAYNDPDKAEFYNYLRGLDALKSSLKNNGNVLMLDKDSELVRIIYGSNEDIRSQSEYQRQPEPVENYGTENTEE